MNNLGGEPFELIEADILDLIGNAFSFPTLPNQFMGFSLPPVDWTIGEIEPFETDIEPIELIDDEATVVLGSNIENESDSLSIANEDYNEYDLDFDEWDYNDFDY